MFETLQISGLLLAQLSPHWYCAVQNCSHRDLLRVLRPGSAQILISVSHPSGPQGSNQEQPWNYSLLLSDIQCLDITISSYILNFFVFVVTKDTKIFACFRRNGKSYPCYPIFSIARIIIIYYVLPIFSRFCIFSKHFSIFHLI